MENEFINAPLLVSRQPPSDPKDDLIKALELKNSKLKTELLKIQRAVEEKFEGDGDEEGPKKRESIFQWEENLDVLNKQLANSYKKIKMYEYEISKLQGTNGSKGTVTQQSTQIEAIIKQKRSMAEKLKQQLVRQQRLSQEVMRRLQNDSHREETETLLKKLTQESKFYKEKIRYFEQKQALKAANMKKQYEAIKKLQNELLQIGVAGGQLEQIKHRAIKNVKGDRGSESRSGRDQINPTNSEEQVEDRTRERYQALLAEISLLQKMQSDHQKQFALAQQERQEAVRRNMASRNKLLQCQNEIENLEKDIAVMKNRVVPSNLKPLNPLRSLSSHQGENPHKILPAKPTARNKALNHLLKYDEVGAPSGKGQRFTDRTLLGKSNLSAKIVGVKVFIERISGLIGGIQVFYEGKKGGEYVRKDRQAKQKQYTQEEYLCKGHASVRSIGGTFSPQDQLQSLSLTCSDGNSHRFGTAKTISKQFNLDIGSQEFPTCVFGSLCVVKETGKREYSLIQHIGFEVQNQSLHNQSGVLNEFNQ